MDFTKIALVILTHPIQVLLIVMIIAHIAPRGFRGARLSMHRLARGRVDEIIERV